MVVFDMGRSLVSLRRRRGRGEEAGVGELDRGVFVCVLMVLRGLRCCVALRAKVLWC